MARPYGVLRSTKVTVANILFLDTATEESATKEVVLDKIYKDSKAILKVVAKETPEPLIPVRVKSTTTKEEKRFMPMADWLKYSSPVE